MHGSQLDVSCTVGQLGVGRHEQWLPTAEKPQSEPVSLSPASGGVAVILVRPGKRGVLQTEALGHWKGLPCLFPASRPSVGWISFVLLLLLLFVYLVPNGN